MKMEQLLIYDLFCRLHMPSSHLVDLFGLQKIMMEMFSLTPLLKVTYVADYSF